MLPPDLEDALASRDSLDLDPDVIFPTDLARASRRPTNMLYLPTEFLLHIIQFLSDDSLLQFSFVSIRLHHIAYPLYISPELEQYSIDLKHISEKPLLLCSRVSELLRRALWVKVVRS